MWPNSMSWPRPPACSLWQAASAAIKRTMRAQPALLVTPGRHAPSGSGLLALARQTCHVGTPGIVVANVYDSGSLAYCGWGEDHGNGAVLRRGQGLGCAIVCLRIVPGRSYTVELHWDWAG